MSEYAIIVQNDESEWNDIKGDLYHYPNKYKNILIPGCKVIYYKSKIKNNKFKDSRLSPDPHYFGAGIVGDSILDPHSSKNDRYCEILDFKEFEQAVPIKTNNQYFEEIPKTREINYWWDGVRKINQKTYNNILNEVNLKDYSPALPNINEDYESYDIEEGKKKKRYTTYYERNPFYRNKAIEYHGLSCMVCGFNFEKIFGNLGKGFIHVHHNKPISETGATRINPITDMSVLCPNCHAMVHRKKDHTLTIEELKKIIKNRN